MCCVGFGGDCSADGLVCADDSVCCVLRCLVKGWVGADHVNVLMILLIAGRNGIKWIKNLYLMISTDLKIIQKILASYWGDILHLSESLGL